MNNINKLLDIERYMEAHWKHNDRDIDIIIVVDIDADIGMYIIM